jgi:hypothetical protein
VAAPGAIPDERPFMESRETRSQRMTRVARELSTSLRREARGGWQEVRTAERNERNRHVWRFQGRGGERFLHIEHRSLVQGKDPAARLLEQLAAERWMDRLRDGPDAALLLTGEGRLAAFEG